MQLRDRRRANLARDCLRPCRVVTCLRSSLLRVAILYKV